jgi:hypothetical protein
MKLYLKNNLKQKGLEACLKGWSSNPSTAKKKKKKKKESIFRLRQQPSYPFRAALCAGARSRVRTISSCVRSSGRKFLPLPRAYSQAASARC